jgi:hypothetical protein
MPLEDSFLEDLYILHKFSTASAVHMLTFSVPIALFVSARSSAVFSDGAVVYAGRTTPPPAEQASHGAGVGAICTSMASGGMVCSKQAASDVGSTAAAALAAAMSSTWQRAAAGAGLNGGGIAVATHCGEGASPGGAQVFGLRRKARFEVVAQIGGSENLYTLSDPSVREHVRRMTAMQVRSISVKHEGHRMWSTCAHALCGYICIDAMEVCMPCKQP